MNATIKTISTAFFGGAIAIGGFLLIPQDKNILIKEEVKQTLAMPVNMSSNLIGKTLDFTQAAEKSLNSVVHITTQTKRKQLSEEEKLFELFYGGRKSKQARRGSGSGVIISEKGYIVTNNHVVENADIIRVILNDNREYLATVIGTDPSTDMAVLKIEETNLEAIAIGNSDDIKVNLILCNNAEAYVLKRAERFGVETYVFRRIELIDSEKVDEVLQNHGIDFIVLAGFMLLFPSRLVAKFSQRIVNIHPALLPKYGGKGMYGMHVHEAVVDNGDSETGITIHWVNEKYDDGQIVFQAQCPVHPDDTPDDVANRVHKLEHLNYPQVIEGLVAKLPKNK